MKRNLLLIKKKLVKYGIIAVILLLLGILEVKKGKANTYMENEKPMLALTFDDGPSSKYTEALLDGLKERNVKATFFVMGKNIEENEGILLRMKEEGHLIGNHTYHHVSLKQVSEEKAMQEIEKTNNRIFEVTGVYPCFFRPPYGAWQKGLDLKVQMLPVLWDIDTLDWKTQNVAAIKESVRKRIKDGAIILMHDEYATTVQAALELIDEYTDLGYQFVTVDRLLGL